MGDLIAPEKLKRPEGIRRTLWHQPGLDGVDEAVRGRDERDQGQYIADRARAQRQ